MEQSAQSRQQTVDKVVVIAGFTAVGKRTLWHIMKGHDLSDGYTDEQTKKVYNGPEKIPEVAVFSDVRYSSLDLEWQRTFSELYWRHYDLNIMDAGILVIDSNNQSRSIQLFEYLMEVFRLRKPDVPMVILANKQDVPGAKPWQDIADDLQLDQVKRYRNVEIFPTSLMTGEGVGKALTWLSTQLQRQALKTAVLQPLNNAIPPPARTACFSLSSALKSFFGQAKKRLSLRSAPSSRTRRTYHGRNDPEDVRMLREAFHKKMFERKKATSSN